MQKIINNCLYFLEFYVIDKKEYTRVEILIKFDKCFYNYRLLKLYRLR